MNGFVKSYRYSQNPVTPVHPKSFERKKKNTSDIILFRSVCCAEICPMFSFVFTDVNV